MSKPKHCTEEDCQQVLDFMVAFSRLLGDDIPITDPEAGPVAL